MREEASLSDYTEPISPRPQLEDANHLDSRGEVDIYDEVFHDERLPHTVYVDSITQQTLDSFKQKGIDLMVREVPMPGTRETNSELGKNEYGSHRVSPDLVVFDIDNMRIGGYEAKSVPKGQEGIEELRSWGRDVRAVNEFHGLEWKAKGQNVQKGHINKSYRSPDRSPRGVYTTRTAFDKVRESDALRKMFDGLYGDEASIEDAMFVSEVKEEWNL